MKPTRSRTGRPKKHAENEFALWMRVNKLDDERVADGAGIPVASVSRYRTGARTPRGEQMRKLLTFAAALVGVCATCGQSPLSALSFGRTDPDSTDGELDGSRSEPV